MYLMIVLSLCFRHFGYAEEPDGQTEDKIWMLLPALLIPERLRGTTATIIDLGHVDQDRRI